MAMSNQMAGGASFLPRKTHPMAEAADSEKRREMEHSPAGPVPSTGDRQDLFKRARGRLEPFLAIPKTRASSSRPGSWTEPIMSKILQIFFFLKQNHLAVARMMKDACHSKGGSTPGPVGGGAGWWLGGREGGDGGERGTVPPNMDRGNQQRNLCIAVALLPN